MRTLELLSPAGNADTAIEAVIHGADAVYIGPQSHGARKNASNSTSEIERVVEFAHRYRAKVYATVNTLVYDSEVKDVERLCRDLYEVGVDALIVQDLGLLRMKLPPIALHASTQIDTRTPEKARFLEQMGFSQIVLARELTLDEIRAITSSVNVAVECFVHGALCVSYSGRCHISQFCRGRSANRGECAQMCRLPYSLVDAGGSVLIDRQHLLSLRDLRQIDVLEQLVQAGVTSFKIEGRLKDAAYVKNVTAAYSQELDRIIRNHSNELSRSSFGHTELNFEPCLEKAFNRGFTHYFLDGRSPCSISNPLTPKSMGEPIHNIGSLNNGDGVSWFNDKGNYVGTQVNRTEGATIITPQGAIDARGLRLHRTLDIEWNRIMSRPSAKRSIGVDITITEKYIKGEDERGVAATVALDVAKDKAHKTMNVDRVLTRTGNTIYRVNRIINHLKPDTFIPASDLSRMRKQLLDLMDQTNTVTYSYDLRKEENPEARYPLKRLDFRENIANDYAMRVMQSHGVTTIAEAIEVSKGAKWHKSGVVLMTTRHCILREHGMCLKHSKRGKLLKLPLRLVGERDSFSLGFACDRCEMEVLSE